VPPRNSSSLPSTPELEKALRRLREEGQVEVREDGELLAGLLNPEFELREQGGKVVLQLWSGGTTLVRRVQSIVDQADGRIELAVQKFGKTRPGRLELRSREAPLAPGRITREQFRARFRELLAGQFPDEDVVSLTTAADLKRSLSGNYARGVQSRGREAYAVLGVPPSESAASADAALAVALLWLDWTRDHNPKKRIAGLRLFLPEGRSQVTCHRLQALSRDLPIEIYELEWAHGRARAVDARDAGNLDSHLVPRRQIERLCEEALRAAKTLGLSLLGGAGSDPVKDAGVDAVVVPGTRAVSWRFRGLEVARYEAGVLRVPDDSYALVPAAGRQALVAARLEALRRFRRPDPADAHHPLYRAQAERWLESLILQDPARIEPRIDPRFVYSQVPAFSFTDRAVLDLLGATRDGRLVVMELKVDEDLQLLPQALDYWLRVRWHREQGDLESLGYFPGLPLADRPPLLYLVAPGLRFHPATETILRFVSRDIEVVRVGLNEEWRKGLRVLFRQERP
jgi:hypothetical protein